MLLHSRSNCINLLQYLSLRSSLKTKQSGNKTFIIKGHFTKSVVCYKVKTQAQVNSSPKQRKLCHPKISCNYTAKLKETRRKETEITWEKRGIQLRSHTYKISIYHLEPSIPNFLVSNHIDKIKLCHIY